MAGAPSVAATGSPRAPADYPAVNLPIIRHNPLNGGYDNDPKPVQAFFAAIAHLVGTIR